MAMESFTELLHKLKDVHEHELEGLQQKVLELTNKKNCDAKRLEELYNRNQQLREQHKMLTENIKQLENMLRAGLCDRCTVTQEMAKKRQQDYETSHLQSLQHISILMGEISALMKENERLKEEVKSLRGRIEPQNGHKEEVCSPEVKACPEPAATIRSQTTSVLKIDQTAPEFATTPKATVKTEPERCLSSEILSPREGTPEKASEHKLVQGWSGTQTFEMTKLTNLAANQSPWKERRASSVESLDPRQPLTTLPFPPHLRFIKNNSVHSPQHSEERPVNVSVPLRPHPIKTSTAWHVPEQSEWVTLGTIASESGSIMVHKHDFSPTILRFPSLVPSECRPPVQSLMFPRPICPPTMNLFDVTESKNKKTTPGDWTGSQPERIFGENLRKVEEEAPLDLSNVRGSKMREKDSASSTSSSPPVPLSSPSSAQYASSPQSNPQASDSTLQREDYSERHKDNGDEEKEKNKNAEIENQKVSSLTISLRPVVVLESLKSPGEKDMEEMEQDSQLLDQPDMNNQGIIRKRSGQSPEALPRRALKLKKTRMTVVAQGPNNDDSDQG